MSWEHGGSGYNNHGCRCDICREGNAENARRWLKKVKGRTPPKHDAHGYMGYGCRCEECTASATEAKRGWRATKLGMPPPEHGIHGYNTYGCRCEVCTAASAKHMRDHRAREKNTVDWIRPSGTIGPLSVTIDIDQAGGGWKATSKQLPGFRVTAGDTVTLQKKIKAELVKRGMSLLVEP